MKIGPVDFSRGTVKIGAATLAVACFTVGAWLSRVVYADYATTKATAYETASLMEKRWVERNAQIQAFAVQVNGLNAKFDAMEITNKATSVEFVRKIDDLGKKVDSNNQEASVRAARIMELIIERGR